MVSRSLSPVPRSRRSARSRASSPHRMTLIGASRMAASAPSTSGVGAWSPPMASTAMACMAVAPPLIGGAPGQLLGLIASDLDDLHLAVLATLHADPVGHPRLATVVALAGLRLVHRCHPR